VWAAVGDVRSGSVKRVASAVGEGSVDISDIHRYLATQDSAASRGQKQTDVGCSLRYTERLPGPAIGFQTADISVHQSLPLNDFYRYIGSARQELERCRRPALHRYECGSVEW
jgi:hypothetical protein